MPPILNFVSAVRDKYEYRKSEDGSSEAGSYGVIGSENTGKKQALDVLKCVYVPDSNIGLAGEPNEISSTCGAIEELDIGGNAFVDWAPVLTIASQLKHLHWLGLDRMQLAPLSEVPPSFTVFGGLHTLCLSGTGMAWDQFLLLSSAMPLLEEVCSWPLLTRQLILLWAVLSATLTAHRLS